MYIKILFMNLEINRDTIKAFILNELPPETMSFVEDAIDADFRFKRMYEEVIFEIDNKVYHAKLMNPIEENKFKDRWMRKMLFCLEVDHHKEKNVSPKELLRRRSVCETAQSQEMNIPKAHAIGMSIKRWLVAASITVMLIVGGGIAYLSVPSDSLENRLYTEYYAPFNSLNDYLLDNNSMAIAKKKYLDGEYINALLLLDELPTSISIKNERDLFIGLSLMEIGKHKEATNYFEEIIATKNRLEYIPHVRWYLGLCYLKTRDKAKAIDTFKTIVDDNGYNYKKAKQILKKLGN